MPTETLEFEESLAAAAEGSGRAVGAAAHRRARARARAPESEAARRADGDLRQAHALAARARVAPPEPARHAPLRRSALYRFRRAARRPPVRRRSRHRGGHRLLQRGAGHGGRPSQGRRYEAEDLPELRLRAARGLSQSHQADAHGRKIPPADRRLRRYAGGVSGRRIGRARRGRGDRVQPARDVGARRCRSS